MFMDCSCWLGRRRTQDQSEQLALIEPYAPESGCRCQQPFSVGTLLRIHFMPQWLALLDLAMEEALHDMPLLCELAGLSPKGARVRSESSILRYQASVGSPQAGRAGLIDATLIAAPGATKNQVRIRAGR